MTVAPRETDAELVARSRGGDVAAFEAIVARHRAALVAVAEVRLSSLADAEDIAQEAFVRAFFRLDSLREPAALLPWLRRMTDRLALMRLRGRREEPIDPEDLEAIRGDARDPVEEVAQAEDLLAELPRPMRQALVLTCLAGYTGAEAARLLGVSEGTVKSRLNRARAKLRDLIEEREEGRMPARRQDDFAQRTLEKLKEEAKRLVAVGNVTEAERRAEAVIHEQVKAFRHGQGTTGAAEVLAVYDDPAFKADEEAVAMLGLSLTDRRRKQFEVNAAQYGFRLEDLDWKAEEVTRWSGTISKPTGHGKDTWGVPRSRLQITAVTGPELCRHLRCSPVTLWEWVKQGCPVLRCWPWARYDVDRVEQWLRDHGLTEWPTENTYLLERPLRILFREVYEGRLSAGDVEQLMDDLGTLVWNEPLPWFTGGWEDGRA